MTAEFSMLGQEVASPVFYAIKVLDIAVIDSIKAGKPSAKTRTFTYDLLA
jgi:hypothetical protein